MSEHLIAAEMLKNVQAEEFLKDQWVFTEGDSSDQTIYCLIKGECEVVKKAGEKEDILEILKPGTLFGELAFISDSPRSAGVRAITDSIKVAKLDGDYFTSPDKLDGNFLLSILCHTINKTYNANKRLHAFFKKNPKLDIGKIHFNLKLAPNPDLTEYMASSHYQFHKSGMHYFNEQPAGQHVIRFIERGKIELSTTLGGKFKKITELKEGDFFGEETLVSEEGNPIAHALLIEDSRINSLDRPTFLKLIKLRPDFLLLLLKNIIRKFIMFENAMIDAEKLMLLSDK